MYVQGQCYSLDVTIQRVTVSFFERQYFIKAFRRMQPRHSFVGQL